MFTWLSALLLADVVDEELDSFGPCESFGVVVLVGLLGVDGVLEAGDASAGLSLRVLHVDAESDMTLGHHHLRDVQLFAGLQA